MSDEALRNHAFRVLDLIVDGQDETAKMQLVRLSPAQLGALAEVVEDVRALIAEVVEERKAGREP